MTDAIIEKIVTGSYSEEELRAFLEEMKAMNEDDYKAMYNRLYQALPDFPDRQMSDTFKIEMEKQLDKRDSMAGATAVIGRRKWWHYAAAAIALLVLAGGIYLFLQPGSAQGFCGEGRRAQKCKAAGWITGDHQ